MGIPLSRAVEAMEIAFKAYKGSSIVLPLVLSFRFVKKNRAALIHPVRDDSGNGNGCRNTPETLRIF